MRSLLVLVAIGVLVLFVVRHALAWPRDKCPHVPRSMFRVTPAAPRIDTPLTIGSYNLYLMPRSLMHTFQPVRAGAVATAIRAMEQRRRAPLDVLLLQEVFVNFSDVLDRLRDAGFRWATDPLPTTYSQGSFLGGGVVIASRWPIVRQAAHTYVCALGQERAASKGMWYAQVQCPKAGVINGRMDVFATHLGAEVGQRNSEVRRTQMFEARTFAKRFLGSGPDAQSTVVLGGDMNECWHVNPGFYTDVARQWELCLPSPARNATLRYTYDTSTNTLVTNGDREWLDVIMVTCPGSLRAHRLMVPNYTPKLDVSDHHCIVWTEDGDTRPPAATPCSDTLTNLSPLSL